jgi:hypothetical protein
MATDLSFSVDVNQIASQLFNAVEGRNDLVVIIQNGTPLTLNLDWTVNHGNLQSVEGPDELDGPAADATSAPYTAIGVDAAGAGSNIGISISCSDSSGGLYTWFIGAITVPNGENNFSYGYYDQNSNNVLGVLSSLPHGPYYANNGIQAFTTSTTPGTAPNTEVSISLTNVSPAICQVQFRAS